MSEDKNLREAGLKVTLPRVRILEIFDRSTERHLSADDVYKKILDAGDEVGLATVYRVLTQFESAGMVKKHHFEGSHAVYEVIEEQHEHMVDVETGKVLEFKDDELMKRLNKIVDESGYQLVDHNLVLHVKKK